VRSGQEPEVPLGDGGAGGEPPIVNPGRKREEGGLMGDRRVMTWNEGMSTKFCKSDLTAQRGRPKGDVDLEG